MDVNGQKSSGDQFDAKSVFRRLSSDASSRKYRRRSPVCGSGSSYASPGRSRSSSPTPTRKNPEKNDERDSGRDWRQHVKSGESRRHSDEKSSRRSHRHPELDDYARPGQNQDDDNRGKRNPDHSRRDSDHRSRHYPHHVDKHYRDKYDDSAHRNRDKERETSYPENLKKKSKDSLSDRIGSRRTHTTRESGMYNEYRESEDEKTDHKRDCKRSKFDIIDVEPKSGINVFKPTSFPVEKQSSSPKHNEVSLEQGVKDSDIDAAKVAAMKAAEQVNRNLIGTGYLTADQKKKLLWGNKKSTNISVEPAHCWDTSTFGDLERQEKFNKLMGVKGNNMQVEHKPGIQDTEKQREQLQMELEKQYTAGLRRRDGRTVGLGL